MFLIIPSVHHLMIISYHLFNSSTLKPVKVNAVITELNVVTGEQRNFEASYSSLFSLLCCTLYMDVVHGCSYMYSRVSLYPVDISNRQTANNGENGKREKTRVILKSLSPPRIGLFIDSCWAGSLLCTWWIEWPENTQGYRKHSSVS